MRSRSRSWLAVVAGTPLVFLTALFAGCRSEKSPPPAPPPPAVTVAKPGTAPVQNYYEYNGYLDAVDKVEIRARVKGFLDEVLFTDGDEVKAGDRLYKIDPREYASAVAKSKSDIAKAVADQANAAAQVQLADTELSRLRGLGTSASKSELDKAVATLAASQAQADVAVANKASAEAALRTAELQLGYTDIRAPIAGRISRTLVTRGNLVGQTDTLLTTIVSTDPVYVYFDAPERDLPIYRGEPPLAQQVFVGVNAEAGFPHAGKLDFRENRVDTGTGTIRIRGILPNTKGSAGERVLDPGQFARVRVPVGPPADRPVIPEEALMTGQEGRFVYVIGPESLVMKRTVQVGMTVWRSPPADDKTAPRWQLVATAPGKDGKTPPPGAVRALVAIESGLTDKDVVVVNGLQKVRPGGPATPDERKLTPPAK